MGEIVIHSNLKDKFVSNPLILLLTISVVSLGLYLTLALRYPLGSSLADPRATWVSMNKGNLNGFAIHLVVYFCLTLLYWATLKLLTIPKLGQNDEKVGQHERRGWIYGLIIISWLAFCMVLMTSAPAGESHDIFDYVFRGRMMVESNANPLIEIPRSYRKDAFIRYVAWQKNVDTYGPLWEMASFGVSTTVHKIAEGLQWDTVGLPSCPNSSDSCHLLIAYITSYRLLAVLLMGVSAALIASIVARSQARLVPAALVAWLWNPLALIATAVGGHNDLLLVLFLLTGLWFMQRQRPFFGLVALILAAHVKLIALIWMPLFVLWILRKWGWRKAISTTIGSLAVGSIISWLLYIPFDGWHSLPRMLHERTLYLANSIWQIIYTYLYKQQGWPKEDALRLTTGFPTWVFIALAILISLWMLDFRPKRWQRVYDPLANEDRRLWTSLAKLSLLYLILGAFWFQHWYVLWVLAPVALIPGSNLTRNVVPWLSFGTLSANLAQGFLLESVPKGEPRTGVYSLTYLIIWGPALIAGLISRLNRRKYRS